MDGTVCVCVSRDEDIPTRMYESGRRFDVSTLSETPKMSPLSAHGMPKPRRMSKTFEPIAFETAMSPWPCLATSSEPIASGTEVPAARTVTPMIAGWIFHMQPSFDAHVTMK